MMSGIPEKEYTQLCLIDNTTILLFLKRFIILKQGIKGDINRKGRTGLFQKQILKLIVCLLTKQFAGQRQESTGRPKQESTRICTLCHYKSKRDCRSYCKCFPSSLKRIFVYRGSEAFNCEIVTAITKKGVAEKGESSSMIFSLSWHTTSIFPMELVAADKNNLSLQTH